MKMSKGPGLFSDFGRKATDLLTRDLLSDRNACTHTDFVRISGLCAATFVSTVITAKLNCPNYASSEVKCEYCHPHASLSGAVGLNKGLPLNLSLTLGTPTFAMGAEASYEMRSKLSNYSAGITLINHDSCASVIV